MNGNRRLDDQRKRDDMDKAFRAKRNEFIYRSFRDVADCDYIAARLNHRAGLYDQFLWSALQAVEKYIKTILLIYDKKTQHIGHDLPKGIRYIELIPDIHWDFDDKMKKFLEFLFIYGGDRYSSFPRGTMGDELFVLDSVIWKIRRYCQDLELLKKPSINLYINYLKTIQSKKCIEEANKFRLLHRGYIERVLDTKSFLKQRECLVYKNFYFGTNKKHRIKYNFSITGSTPVYKHFPEIIPWIKNRVKISPLANYCMEMISKKP